MTNQPSPRALRAAAVLALCGVAALSFHAVDGSNVSDDAERTDASRALAARTAAADIRVAPAGPSTGLDGDTRAAGSYWSDRLQVRAAPGEDLDALLRDHDLELRMAPGRAGVAAVTIADGADVVAVKAELETDDRVASVGFEAVMRGAAKGGKGGKAGGGGGGGGGGDGAVVCDPNNPDTWTPEATTPFDWHLNAVNDDGTARDYSTFTVAVLDSGVAYETYADAHGSYVPAPSLSTSPIVAPIDIVNGDLHANDDHQHGTHIASIIASKGGGLRGIVGGVGLMPVKVLDEQNRGSELTLVEGILHAVANGADVINMSLSFDEGYVPSPALMSALATARDAGVVMVAAAGNDSANYASWPAAHPDVIGVAAVRPGDSTIPCVDVKAADYANRAPGVDLVAPGGDVTADRNGDGYVDGVIGETIAPGDPTDIGLWLMAGSSQATAMVSGVAVQLLQTGLGPNRVGRTLQSTADETLDGEAIGNGYGRGLLIQEAAWEVAKFERANIPPARRYYAAVLPYMERLPDGQVRPMAKVTVINQNGVPADEMPVYGAFRGTTGGPATCTVPLGATDGSCTLVGQPAPAQQADGTPAPLSWSVTVDSVEDFDIAYHPNPAMFLTDQLEVITAAMDDHGDLEHHALAVSWGDVEDPQLGSVASGYSVVHSGTGLATSPLGLVFNSTAVDGLMSEQTITLDLDGTGLATSPLGMLPMTLLSIDGTGLATSPLGMRVFDLATIDGTGLATSPLGFTALSLYAMGGTGLATSPMGFSGNPILLDSGMVVGASAGDWAIGDKLADGGWVMSDGVAPGPTLTASGVMETSAISLDLFGSGAGTTEYTP